MNAVESNRAAWTAKVAQRVEQRKDAVRLAIDALEQAQRELREDKALSFWLHEFPHGRFKPGAGTVAALHRPSGEPTPLADVLAALRQMVEPPKPASDKRPLQRVA